MSDADVTVRAATPGERVAVLSVLDAAMLETDADALAERIAAGSVLVATAGGRDGETGRVLGAIEVRETRRGGHVEAVAVRRRRRDRGVGTALVEAAAERWHPLSAAFDADVRPFYERLGFEVERIGDGRYRGRLH